MLLDRPDLWLAVALLGAWHGLNPGMGWPLAVSRGLFERRGGAVAAALAPLAFGHLLAIGIVLLPLAMLLAYVEHARTVGVAAGFVVLAFGLWRLIDRRHPQFLRRVRPSQLALWSFLIGVAHGAGLMLAPVLLGLCAARPDRGALADPHGAAMALIASGTGIALAVTLLHTAAMIATGGVIAYIVYRTLGLSFLRRSWLNLDTLWAASLVASGAIAILMAAGLDA